MNLFIPIFPNSQIPSLLNLEPSCTILESIVFGTALHAHQGRASFQLMNTPLSGCPSSPKHHKVCYSETVDVVCIH
jgi:hypothetical protein